MSRPEFEKTELFNECYRGYTHGMMTFKLPSPRNINCSFVLSRNERDFSERDRQVLTALQPQLAVLYRAAVVRAESLARIATGYSGMTECGVVIASEDGSIRTINHEAYTLLDTYGGRGFSAHRLPASVCEYLDALKNRGHASYQPIELFLSDRSESLILRPARLPDGWAILAESSGSGTTSLLRKHGLTPKEIEVLGWIAQGKSNAEIGIILGSSDRTVQKHVQNLLNKLQVDNRVGALIKARELIGEDAIIPEMR